MVQPAQLGRKVLLGPLAVEAQGPLAVEAQGPLDLQDQQGSQVQLALLVPPGAEQLVQLVLPE